MIAFVLLAWAAIFTYHTATDAKVGFDYDDTVAFSTPSFNEAFSEYGKAAISTSSDSYLLFWSEVNSKPERDLVKPVTMRFVRLARFLGADPVLITARLPAGSEYFIDYWDETFDEIYFLDDKSRVLGRDNFIAFFGDSDSDIDEAEEAGVLAIRILRHEKSSYTAKNNPGSRDEIVIRNSHGPAN